MDSLFVEISLALTAAFLVASIMRLLRQPLIISYILSGLVLGPHVFGALQSTEVLTTVSHLGIALLLFIVGLGLNPQKIKKVGRPAATIGIGQVVITSAIGFLIAQWFGYMPRAAVYIALSMALSSTVVILKILSDKGDLDQLYGRISIGFLLVQDIVAAGMLVYISSVGANQPLLRSLSESVGLLLGIVFVLMLVVRYVLPHIANFLARSQEYLFLFAVAWGFGIAAVVGLTGLSIEIGALIAGVALSTQMYAREISNRLRPLRDFFLLFFFITLGAGLDVQTLVSVWEPVVALSVFVLVGNPLIVMSLAGYFGYTKHTSFKTAITSAQISEFSLVFILLAAELGQVSPSVVTTVTVVGLITIAGSTYMMRYDEKIYSLIRDDLDIFVWGDVGEVSSTSGAADIFLFGFNHNGQQFVDAFKYTNHDFMVVDYDPKTIAQLEDKGIKHSFGDITDPDYLSDIQVAAGKMVISAISDFDANLYLTKYLHRKNPDMVVVVYSEKPKEAAQLYKSGATYVIMPHFLGNKELLDMIANDTIDESNFLPRRDKHLRYLQQHLE